MEFTFWFRHRISGELWSCSAETLVGAKIKLFAEKGLDVTNWEFDHVNK